eukprot:m.1540274 g.1540274  ORF g.1540274 m.1540274 type:complete len:1737 (+) comp25248_c0_seq2:948-6158(+)
MVETTTWIQTNELDSAVLAALRSFENSNYHIRRAVARFLGTLMSSCQQSETWEGVKASRRPSADDLKGILSSGFAKGGSSAESRIGVAQAYVVYLHNVGANWIEKHVSSLTHHMLHLLTQKQVYSEDGIYARKCVLHIIMNVQGRMLGEKGRTDTVLAVCKHVTEMLDSAKDVKDPQAYVHAVVCGLNAAAALVDMIGSAVVGKYDTIMHAVFAAAFSPLPSIRFAAAHCLRSLGNVLPSRASFLANQCMDRMKKHRTDVDAVHGAGYLLAAVVGGSASSSLGLPHELSASILNLGQQLTNIKGTRAATSVGGGKPLDVAQAAKRVAEVDAGWSLVASLTALGSAAVDPHVRDIINLWTAVFPSSSKNTHLPSPKDVGGWKIELCHRLGALTSMEGVLLDCTELATIDITKMIARCLQSALKFLAKVPQTSKAQSLKFLTARLRVRMYAVHLLIPVHIYEESIPALLPYLVADFTLVEQVPTHDAGAGYGGGTSSNNVAFTTSLLQSMCNDNDGMLLREGNHETDEQDIEDILREHGCLGLRAFENDPHVLCAPSPRYAAEPLATPTTVVNNAVLLFGTVYPCIASQKHRHQLLEHFATCIKGTKALQRRQAVQVNIFTAFLAALKHTVTRRTPLGSEKVVLTARSLALDAVVNADETLRCAAGEALGRMAQVVGGPFAGSLTDYCIDRIRKDANIAPRTGLSLGLGCIHRYIGSMGAGKSRHLKSSVDVLCVLAKESEPTVAAWALHSLTLTVNAAGQALSSLIDVILSIVHHVVLATPDGYARVLECAGKLLNTVITAIGPELQVDVKRRDLILALTKELQESRSGQVRLTGLNGMQQIIIFAPKFVDIPTFIPRLQTTLSSRFLQLRLAAAACLRQLAQRDAGLVLQHGEHIEKQLFRMLDSETNARILSDLREAIVSILVDHAHAAPSHWLIVCNNVLSGAAEKEAVLDDADDAGGNGGGDGDEGDDGSEAVGVKVKATVRTVLPTRWQTKVFAVTCVRKVIELCTHCDPADNPHLHLSAARHAKNPKRDFLVAHLGELVRTTYLAATSTINELRQVGIHALEDIIANFSQSLDVDLGGTHTLLEQYQAQVTSALRPAFDASTPPDVTCIAAAAVASWICSGVYRTIPDLRRVLTLLADRLEAVRSAPDPAYNERATTNLRLALLTSWAKIAIKAFEVGGHAEWQYLVDIVSPHVPKLLQHWRMALKDYALISLPPEYTDQIPPAGTFYYPGTTVAVLPYFDSAFPVLVVSAAMYTSRAVREERTDDGAEEAGTKNASSDFYLLLGLCTRALCHTKERDVTTVTACITALSHVLDIPSQLSDDPDLLLEILYVLQTAARDYGAHVRVPLMATVVKIVNSANNLMPSPDKSTVGGESVVNAVLELCTLVLVSEVPGMDKVLATPGDSTDRAEVRFPTTGDSAGVVSNVITVLSHLPAHCSDQERLSVLKISLGITLHALAAGAGPNVLQAVRTLLKPVEGSVAGADNDWQNAVVAGCMFVLNALETPDATADAASGARTKDMLLALALFVLSNKSCAASVRIQVRVAETLGSIIGAADIPPEARQTATQVLASLLKQADPGFVAVCAQHACPHVLMVLQTVTHTPPATAPDVLVVKEALAVVSALLAAVAVEHRGTLVALVIPLLVGVLNPQATGPARQVHYLVLEDLKRIGPAYPAEFKAVMTSKPELAQSLSNAIKMAAASASPTRRSAATTAAAAAAPKIALKMDFSAFG